MPLDAICLKGVVQELQSAVGLRIEKIQQPERDQVVLTLRGNRKLFLCANATQPRIHFTALTRENPATPPMFCMLLRKYLQGGYITAIEQAGVDRVVSISIRAMDEMGVAAERKLVLECMSRRANLIVLDSDGRIVGCLRHVDMEMSQQRQILPGLFYRLPPVQEKRDPLCESEEDFSAALHRCDSEVPLSSFLLDRFLALSPLVCRELSFVCSGRTDLSRGELGETECDVYTRAFLDWQSRVNDNYFTPYLVRRDGRPADFSYFPIRQYGEDTGENCESFSAMLDLFYQQREQIDRVRQKGQDLMKAATTARDRIARKIAAQETELEETRNREQLRIRGELITANLYRMKKGERILLAENYYEPDCPTMEIALDPLLTPQQNAERYYKQYTKAKTAERYLTEQLAKGRSELEYLNSILDELSRAELEQDFNDIRTELRQAGYLKGHTSGKKEPRRQPQPSKPRQFRSSAGLRILVGRSNTQNDTLTREADRRDIWLHTQKIHGSHVILCTEGAPADEQSLLEAAMLAAWFSQGRQSSRVAVDYTAVRHVKKPNGARPGMVVYDPYQTAFVTPDEDLVKKLAVK